MVDCILNIRVRAGYSDKLKSDIKIPLFRTTPLPFIPMKGMSIEGMEIKEVDISYQGEVSIFLEDDYTYSNHIRNLDPDRFLDVKQKSNLAETEDFKNYVKEMYLAPFTKGWEVDDTVTDWKP